jgi:hypothetical protein
MTGRNASPRQLFFFFLPPSDTGETPRKETGIGGWFKRRGVLRGILKGRPRAKKNSFLGATRKERNRL